MTGVALITGGTGFIGRHVSRLFVDRGWAVHSLVRPGITADTIALMEGQGVAVHQIDGTFEGLRDIVRHTAPDVVIHLAAEYLNQHTPADLDRMIDANIRLTIHLLEAMKELADPKLVYAGTAWQTRSSTEYEPVNLYASMKQASSDIVRYYVDICGFSTIDLRLFDTYGPGDRRRKVLDLMLDAARSGAVLGMSPGLQILDMTHVEDVADAFEMAANLSREQERGTSRTYFISGERLSLLALGAMIVDKSQGGVIAFGALPYRKFEVMRPIEISSTKRLPGWKPTHTLQKFVDHQLGRDGVEG